MTPMKPYEYFQMKLNLFPQDIINKYDLTNHVDQNGNVHCEVRRGMYGLPQAGIITQELLEERLKKAGYTQSKFTPGNWKHKWRPISFTLVVGNFGVTYIGKEHVMHLIKTLNEHYKVEEDWEGRRYLGITLRLGLQEPRSTPLHARVRRARTGKIQPSHTRQAPTPTPSTRHPQCTGPLYNMQNLKAYHNGYLPPRKSTSKK